MKAIPSGKMTIEAIDWEGLLILQPDASSL